MRATAYEKLLPPLVAKIRDEEDGQRYDFVFVDQKGFEDHAPGTFAALASSFTEYK